MSYLVLARKYRPQTFKDLIGQEHVTQTLRNAIITKHIAHSYIFSGARGCGKTSAARIFSKAVNCERIETMNGEPCNECTSCKEITAGNALDVIEIDGASNRGIDEIRNLRENVKYTPAKTRYKIYIIDEVHMLSKDAFNALLKTLEEPPEHIIFIFATTEPHSLPTTILSRCQRYDFHRIPVQTITSHLKMILDKEHVTYEDEAIIEIAKNAGGSFRDSQTLLDQLIAFSAGKILIDDVRQILGLVKSEIYARFLDCVIEDKKSEGIEIIHMINNEGHDLISFFNGLVEFLRNIMVLQVTDPSKASFLVDVADKDLETLKKYASKMEQSTVLSLMNLVIESMKELKYSNTPLAYAEVIFFKMPDINKGINLNNLYNQILKIKQSLTTQPQGTPRAQQVQPPPQANAQLQPDMSQAKNMFNTYLANPSPSGDEKKKDEPLTLEIIRGRWREFTDSPAAKKIQAVRSFALCCDFASFENGILFITISSHIAYSELQKPETMAALQKELSIFFKTPITLNFTFKENKIPIQNHTDNNTAENPSNPASTTDYEPLIRSAIKIFGGDRLK